MLINKYECTVVGAKTNLLKGLISLEKCEPLKDRKLRCSRSKHLTWHATPITIPWSLIVQVKQTGSTTKKHLSSYMSYKYFLS